MFGWRRKSDGFEWHKYVRTTIKLRRNERKKKIDQLKHAAADQVQDAGRASLSAGRTGAALARQGLGALWDLLISLPGWVLLGCIWLGRAAGRLAAASWRFTAAGAVAGWRVVRPILASCGRGIAAAFGQLRRPGVASLLAGAAIPLLAYGLWHLLQAGPTPGVAGALILAVVLAGLAAFARVNRRPLSAWLPAGLPLPKLPASFGAMPLATRRLAAGAGALAIAAGLIFGGQAAWTSIWPSGGPQLGSLGALSSFVTGTSETVKGRARAVSGDTLLVAGRTIRLSGIEAPETMQRCRTAGGRSWRCGVDARRRLQRLVRREIVTCDVWSGGGKPTAEGRCQIGASQDLAEEMVRQGYAFSMTGLMARYAGEERDAKLRKAGVWQGEAKRPSAFRAALWARAKRVAPDGCPIKGRILSRGRVYVLPWSPYYRRIRVSSRRGERWFCSEAEAIAAGWKPASAG